MQIIRGSSKLPSQWTGCVATIGNFDGVHRGHQAIFSRLQELKSLYQLPVLVMLFEPHPREFFSPDISPPRINSLRDKIALLKSLAVDIVYCIRFNRDFASVSAEDFIDTVLTQQLHVAHLVIGSDFRFGHRRVGDVALLEQKSAAGGYRVECCSAVERAGRRISSTWIRECLAAGDLQEIQHLLGRPYQIQGRVLRGQQRGREWGFPTINLAWPFTQHTLQGIYAVRVFGLDPEPILGAASVGCRPTVDGQDWNIEVHLFDFSEDCYGKMVTVQFLQWFREERHFATIDELKLQIAMDVEIIRAYFNKD